VRNPTLEALIVVYLGKRMIFSERTVFMPFDNRFQFRSLKFTRFFEGIVEVAYMSRSASQLADLDVEVLKRHYSPSRFQAFVACA
jgi:hypothetical protein